MKTPIEIAAMPLIERQILVADLRNVPPTDKLYAVALQLIAAATAKGWSEPDLVEVKNIAGHDITVDKTKISKDGTAKIFPWQYLAVRRFVEPTDEDSANEAIEPLLRVPSKNEGLKPISRDEILGMIKESKSGMSAAEITKLVAQTVAETLKAAGIKAAAICMVAFLFCFAGRASAQTQSYMVGSVPSLYHTYSVAGLNGGTNTLASGTSTYFGAVTNVSNVVTNPNWSVINGQATNIPTFTTNPVVNVPGEVSLVNYDEAGLFLGYNSFAGITSETATWDFSQDSVYWQSNALTMFLIANSSGLVGTNYFFPIGQVPAFIRLDTLTVAGSGTASNQTVEVGNLRPKRNGP